MAIPVSLAAIAPITGPAVEPTSSPAQLIAKSGEAIVNAYRKYDVLRLLASRLNGLQESAPLPAGLNIKSIKISFELDGAHWNAEVDTVHKAGDLARLLSGAIADLVKTIRDEASAARMNAEVIEDVCNRAVYNANVRQMGGGM